MVNFKQTQAINSNKDLSLEVMRIVAIIFVIFNHTSAYLAFSDCELGNIEHLFGLFFSIFCKFAVPLFFMISGALLLGKQEPLNVILKKRFFRMVVVLVVFSILAKLFNMVANVTPYRSVASFFLETFLSIYSGEATHTTWFICAYIAFLLLLPFLRMVAEKMDLQLFKYILTLYIIFKSIIPIFQLLVLNNEISIAGNFFIFTTDILVFPLVGYFLYNKVDFSKIKNSTVLILWIVNIVSIFICCFLFYWEAHRIESNEIYQSFHNTFAIINSSTIFITIKKFVKINNSSALSKIVKSAGECTFGIYLLHIFPIIFLNYTPNTNIFCIVLLSLGYSILLFLVCWLVTFVLRKIPLVKKFI